MNDARDATPASPTITLDGEQVPFSSGETVYEISQRHAKNVPTLCYDDRLDPFGGCRLCVVELEGSRNPVASCTTKAQPGMVICTGTEKIEKYRKTLMELVVSENRQVAVDPLSGYASQELENLVERYQVPVKEGRFQGSRSGRSKEDDNPFLLRDYEQCISCYRCVRVCAEQQGDHAISVMNRGFDTRITTEFNGLLRDSDCTFCGQCVQTCPTGALGDKKALKNATLPEKINKTRSTCPYCGVGCQIEYNVKDNDIKYVNGIDGPANKNRLCVKGRFGFDYVSHAERLTKPLIRIKGKKKELHPSIDFSNLHDYFKEVTWKEALEFASSGLLKLKNSDGPSAFAGFGSAKCSNEEAYLFQKLIRTGLKTNNVDHCTRLCHASSVAALLETIGSGAVTAPFYEVEHSEVIIVIGANPTENHPVAATFFKNAAKKGSKLIVMDPRGQALRKYATHMLQFKSGTDVALLNSIMHVIIEENLFDQEYIKHHTLGFEQLKEHLKMFSPDKMFNNTGIVASKIREVARLFANTKKGIIFWGMGISQHIHGTDNARCLISLALMTGNVGQRGTGLHPLRGQNNVQGASDAGLIPMMYPDYQLVASDKTRKFFEDFWKTDLDPSNGLTVVEIMNAIHDGQIKGMYILGENPAMSDPDLNHARESLQKLEHLIVQDIFLTETATYADVILPASAWPEKDGTVTNTNRQVQLGRKALETPGAAREDWWITNEIGKRLGLDWKYKHPKDIFKEMAEGMPSLNNITWERLEKENSVTYPCHSLTAKGEEIVFGDQFPIEGGKGKFVPADVISPDEMPDKEYPMILTTGRQLEHWHTGAMTRKASNLDAIEPESTISLSPKDIQKIQINAGDFIEVSTRRGKIKTRVREDRSIPEGVIFMPFCYEEAAANLLTNSALDPFGKIPELKFCSVKLEELSNPIASKF